MTPFTIRLDPEAPGRPVYLGIAESTDKNTGKKERWGVFATQGENGKDVFVWASDALAVSQRSAEACQCAEPQCAQGRETFKHALRDLHCQVPASLVLDIDSDIMTSKRTGEIVAALTIGNSMVAVCNIEGADANHVDSLIGSDSRGHTRAYRLQISRRDNQLLLN